jgi:hypothetical protein
MKWPNFRLYSTQATASLAAGLAGLVCTAMLMYCVFRGFQLENMIIPYNPESSMGQYRRYLVMGLTALSVGVGGLAGLLGFRSMGEKRNDRQGRSWAGLALSALIIPAAIVLFQVWQTLSEEVILK